MEWNVASWYQNLRIDLIGVCYLDEEVVFFAGTTLNGMIWPWPGCWQIPNANSNRLKLGALKRKHLSISLSEWSREFIWWLDPVMKYYMHDEKSGISSNEHAMIFQGKMIVCYWSQNGSIGDIAS